MTYEEDSIFLHSIIDRTPSCHGAEGGGAGERAGGGGTAGGMAGPEVWIYGALGHVLAVGGGGELEHLQRAVD